jgi:hypothetical protein
VGDVSYCPVKIANLIAQCSIFATSTSQPVDDAASKLVPARQTSTHYVSWRPWNLAIIHAPLILVEVRIMNYTIIDLSCPPAECLMTVDAPHLVASIDLRYSGSTGRTWLGVCFNHSSCLHIVFITCVLIVFVITDDLKTLWARVKITDFAFVSG